MTRRFLALLLLFATLILLLSGCGNKAAAETRPIKEDEIEKDHGIPVIVNECCAPCDGDDPLALTGIENVMRIAYVLQHAENYTLEGRGTVKTKVAFISYTQDVEANKAEGKRTGLLDNIKVLFTNRIAVKTALFLATIYLTWNLVASVLGFFLPHIYETAGGISNEQANWIASTQWMACVVVTFFLSFLLDRISHKLVYIVGLLVAISAWVLIVMVGVNSRAVLWAFALLWGIQSGLSVQIFYALWGSELFPAKFRAGAQGLMFFAVRGLSAV